MENGEIGELPRLRTRLAQLSPQTSQHSIYKVPGHLRDVNSKAFEPQIVAVGPYNRGKPKLKDMEEVKLRYMQALVARRPDVPFEDYISAIEGMSKRARDCYAESSIKLNDDEFTDMLVLDGCFIIEVIQDHELFSQTFPNRSSLGILKRDLILLENQIPFFVVCKLFDLIRGPDEHMSLIKKVFIFCHSIFPRGILYRATKVRSSKKVQHILDLIHSNCCPPSNNSCDDASTTMSSSVISTTVPVDDQGCCASWCLSRKLKLLDEMELSQYRASTTIFSSSGIPSASELKDANLKFRHKEYDSPPHSSDHHTISVAVEGCCASWCRASTTISAVVIPSASELKDANVKFRNKEYGWTGSRWTSLFDVEFSYWGKMVMPTLVIDDWTESLLRNLIAYEQFFPAGRPSFVVDYTILLDRLINTSKDVRILCRAKIIENLLGSEEAVVELVNKLGDGVVFCEGNFVYADTFRRINVHHQKCWYRAVAALHRDYFNSAWAYVAFLGALTLLLLAAFQTAFSALQL